MIRVWGRIFLGVVAAALVVLLAIYLRAVVGPPGKPNVLLITVDTLRADHMSLYGYSRATTRSIERWFGKGRVFERAYSTESSTSPSVVSMLTGLLPQRHRVRLLYQKLPAAAVTMADYLRAGGYETAAVVSNVVLTEEASGLGSRFDYYDDFVDEKEPYRQVFERRASRTTDAAIKWLRGFRPTDKPHFFWVHYIDPHGPYRPPEDRPVNFSHSVPKLIDIERLPYYQREPTIHDGLEYVDLYDEEIAYTDREIGRLLSEYERLGLRDNTLVIFTADHGETMMEFEKWFTHAYHIYEPLIHVPLVIIGPGISPARVKIPVSLVDLLPTVLSEVGLPVPEGLDGISLSAHPEPRPVFAEATYGDALQWRCVIEGDRKWVVAVRRQRNRPLVNKTVYRVGEENNGKAHDKWTQGRAAARELMKLALTDPDPAGWPQQYEEGARLDAPKVAPDVDQETLKKLRALGYVK